MSFVIQQNNALALRAQNAVKLGNLRSSAQPCGACGLLGPQRARAAGEGGRPVSRSGRAATGVVAGGRGHVFTAPTGQKRCVRCTLPPGRRQSAVPGVVVASSSARRGSDGAPLGLGWSHQPNENKSALTVAAEVEARWTCLDRPERG